MRLADHNTWDCEDSNFGKSVLCTLADHFQEPLKVHKFNQDLALKVKDMNAVKSLKATQFKGFNGILADYHHKFPHFLLIIELCLVKFSSSTLERGFSTLKRHLQDSRLSLKNATLNDLLLVKIKTPLLRKLDLNYEGKLVQKAVDMYMNSPELKRGRYHHTSTQRSEPMAHQHQPADTPNLFLPVSVSALIGIGEPSTVNEDDIEISDSDSDCGVARDELTLSL